MSLDEKSGRSIGRAWVKGYVEQRLRQPHSARCDAVAGDWKGEVCNLSPRACDCWCHLDEAVDRG